MKSLQLTIILLLAINISKNYAQQNLILSSYSGQTQSYASESITLSNGFHVPVGDNFRAFISYVPTLPCKYVGPILNNNRNYVLSYTSRIAGLKSISNLEAKNTCEVAPEIQFFDGLGRPLQILQIGATPLGYDIVKAFRYDTYGRSAINYLAYSDVFGSNGNYKEDAFDLGKGLNNFYNPIGDVGTELVTGAVKTAYPFKKTVFEPSPLNRVLEQGEAGVNWQPLSGRTVKMENDFNKIDEVRNWTISGTNCSGVEYFGANELFKTISKDENWISGKGGTHEEFKDKLGRIIMKRKWLDETTAISTYYVYDELGNLRYIITPAVTLTTFSENDSVFNEFIYAYHYDLKKRIIEKKIPGKGWEELVYNSIDQLVLSRDAKQMSDGQWLFKKYDVLERNVISGIINNSESRVVWQERLNNDTQHSLWESRDDNNESGSGTGYTSNAFPLHVANNTYLIINYYDNYNFYNNVFGAQTFGQTIRTRGLETGKRVNILGTTTMLLTVNYYDDKALLISSKEQNHLGGTDFIENDYTFNGELRQNIRKNIVNNMTTKITQVYNYDQIGRRISTTQDINDGGWVIISKKDYNEIGQLKTKSLHSVDNGNTFLQHSNYTYNERGWITSINDPNSVTANTIFGMSLNYANKPDAYNGNIGSISWQTMVPPGLGLSQSVQNYSYDYDNLNRLIKANYMDPNSTNKFNEELAYDVMGNIISLKRTNSAAGYLNYFTYDYTHNGQLSNKVYDIGDTGTASQSNSYTYDVNGNQKTNNRLGITNIDYNYLNLPKSITKASTGEVVEYTYNALGIKLKKQIGVRETNYLSGIQYTGSVIDFVVTEEGRALPNSPYVYEYFLQDQLGNTRVVFKANGDIVQIQDYYAFGLEMNPGNMLSSSPENQYKYNGKEKQAELGLDQLDYGARFYDPLIGRWNVVDPKAELLEMSSPYVYSLNSPVNFIDKNGELPIFINGRVNHDYERHDKRYWDAQLLSAIAGSGIPNPGNTAFYVDGDRGAQTHSRSPRYENESSHYTEVSNYSLEPSQRTAAGRIVAKRDFKNILAQLEKDPKTGKITEKIQIYTHSRGAAFGVGYTEALLELIKENSGLFADAANEIEFVFNMAPHQSNSLTSPEGVDAYSSDHTLDPFSGDDMSGLVAAFKSNQNGNGVPLIGPHSSASFRKDVTAFLKAWQEVKGDPSKMANSFIKAMKEYGIKVTVH
ncbi:DUF6443 domain-containing protein [Pedobacter sp. KR3-3]|uniref:DUF6443 domain-containing protein n=1 Tax=Pedobacter albus TaxID=3113905 RepID=A0ABU7I9L2_9SPHI|nr:DUF6443 domain-containing protein [Pedobacter sp. KR3-3]MEE1945894.1 DUF6443 domain-containing protein [Pedobacter sp. KR3-3]